MDEQKPDKDIPVAAVDISVKPLKSKDKEKKNETGTESLEPEIPVWEDRKKEWREDDKVKKQLSEIYATVLTGFDDKADQNQVIERAWDIYNCNLNENQVYDGDSAVYLPIVHDAIEARVTRFSNAIFPNTGRYSEVLSDDAKVPYETMAVLDHYVDMCSLRDNIAPALMRAGDIEGQYSLFISWQDRKRYSIKKIQTALLSDIDLGTVDDAGKTDDIEIETIDDSRPDVMVLDARDLLVQPASVDEIDDADVVAIALRLSKGKIQKMIDDGDIDEDAGEVLIENMGMAGRDMQPDPDKKNLNAAGVKKDSKGNKTALVYMIWTRLKIGGKRRMCMTYMAGSDNILSCKRNPYWSDRVPVITQAALKVNGSIWGKSRVETVEKSQYAANDAFNMGQDSIKYSLMPVINVDPERFNATSVVLTMGSMWLGPTDALKIIEFPNRWPDAERVVDVCRNQIMQSLGTNPAMMPMGNSGKKPTQAQISQEQQVALESTADVITILESSVFNKVLRWFYELDYQFRSEDINVRRFGPVGMQAEMQAVPPILVDTKYTFKWYGSEGQKSAQQIQQMISLLGVIRGIPPEQMNGRRIDASPIIEAACLATFGPRIAPTVLINEEHDLTVPPQEEDSFINNGFPVMVHPADDDVMHMQVHALSAKMTGDPTGEFKIHIDNHMKQLRKKSPPAQPPSAPGGPPPQGGGPAARPGSQAQAPTGPQQPAGAVRPDQMPMSMPPQ